jgi:hypothetical protein
METARHHPQHLEALAHSNSPQLNRPKPGHRIFSNPSKKQTPPPTAGQQPTNSATGSTGWQQVEDAFGDLVIVGDPDWASDRLVDVGNLPVSPAPYLVAEDSKATQPSHSDRTLRHHTSSFAMQVRNRSLLNHVVTVWSGDDQRRMVEITPRTTGNESRRGFEELPADPHNVRART